MGAEAEKANKEEESAKNAEQALKNLEKPSRLQICMVKGRADIRE